MPQIVTGHSRHYEGENITTMARVVGGSSQTLLTQDTSGALSLRVIKRGAGTVYTKTIAADAGTGIKDTPISGAPHNVRGVLNLEYEWDIADLAGESPPFTFNGGNNYLLVYDFASPIYGHVIMHHRVQVAPSP